MTTKRQYLCNLCHGTVIEGRGVGLVWTAANEFDFTVPSNAETHICQPCLNAVVAANQKTLAIADARAAADSPALREGTPQATQNPDGTTTWTDNAGSETRVSFSSGDRKIET
jgi:hypothetical protein